MLGRARGIIVKFTRRVLKEELIQERRMKWDLQHIGYRYSRETSRTHLHQREPGPIQETATQRSKRAQKGEAFKVFMGS